MGQTSLVRSQLLEESHAELQVEGCEEEERSFDSEVRVATLQFSELQIEFVVVVFILVVILAKLGKCTALHIAKTNIHVHVQCTVHGCRYSTCIYDVHIHVCESAANGGDYAVALALYVGIEELQVSTVES